MRAVLAQHPDEKTISLLAISVWHLEEHWNLELEPPLGLQMNLVARHQDGHGTVGGRPCHRQDPRSLRMGCHWYGSVVLGIARSVPDEFRELTENDL